MIYIVQAHDSENKFRNYFIGLYTDKDQALAGKHRREHLHGDQGYFIDEFTAQGQFSHHNIQN